MVSADAQLGIVGFLRGERVAFKSSLAVDPMLKRDSFYAETEIETEMKARCVIENNLSAKDNGLDIAEGCKGCSALQVSQRFHVDHCNYDAIVCASISHCLNNGCEKARKEFLNNAGKMKLEGKLKIDITVDTHYPDPPTYMDISHRSHAIATLEKRTEIHARRMNSENDFFTTGNVSPYSKKPTTSVENELKELERMFTEESNRYDVEVW